MKKGFTLIELLAVIVILAIIALIATPIVLSIINDSKESAVIRSAEFYVDAVENKIMQENMKQGGTLNPEKCIIGIDGNATCDGKLLEIEVNGEKPTSGNITFDKGKVIDINLIFGDKTVSMNTNGELVLVDRVEQKLAPGLYDETGKLTYSWEQLISEDIINVTDGSITQGTNSASLVGKLVIDESVTNMGSSAFSGCTGLTSITIPNSVASIGGMAFNGCSGLTSVTIPSSITKIDNGLFQDCTGLTSVTIPESVISIGLAAFHGCTGLTSITIPSSVRIISNRAFYGCTNLSTIYYSGTATGSPWGAPNATVVTG